MKNILVFPCGSEIALEIYRSLRYSTHFKLIGANSLDDHGKFVRHSVKLSENIRLMLFTRLWIV